MLSAFIEYFSRSCLHVLPEFIISRKVVKRSFPSHGSIVKYWRPLIGWGDLPTTLLIQVMWSKDLWSLSAPNLTIRPSEVSPRQGCPTVRDGRPLAATPRHSLVGNSGWGWEGRGARQLEQLLDFSMAVIK